MYIVIFCRFHFLLIEIELGFGVIIVIRVNVIYLHSTVFNIYIIH